MRPIISSRDPQESEGIYRQIPRVAQTCRGGSALCDYRAFGSVAQRGILSVVELKLDRGHGSERKRGGVH